MIPRPSSGELVRRTSPACSIRLTVWVTPLRLWASASASCAIRIRRPGALGEPDQDLVLDQRQVEGPAQVVVEAVQEQRHAIIRARQEFCWSSLSHLVSAPGFSATHSISSCNFLYASLTLHYISNTIHHSRQNTKPTPQKLILIT